MRRILLMASASACLFAFPSRAAETVAKAPSPLTAGAAAVVVPTEAALEAARVERAQRAVLNARMEAVIETSKKAVAGLQTMIDATSDPATLKNLEGRMAQVKRGTKLDLLRVQATFARENGRIEQADRIDAEVAEILNPTRKVQVRTPSARSGVVAPEGGAR